MPNAPLSSSSALNWLSLSRSAFPARRFWQPFLRVIWFVIALLFAGFNLTAEFKLMKAVDGSPKYGEQILAEADEAIRYFPFDTRLRQYRNWIRREVAFREQQGRDYVNRSATGQEGF